MRKPQAQIYNSTLSKRRHSILRRQYHGSDEALDFTPFGCQESGIGLFLSMSVNGSRNYVSTDVEMGDSTNYLAMPCITGAKASNVVI